MFHPHIKKTGQIKRPRTIHIGYKVTGHVDTVLKSGAWTSICTHLCGHFIAPHRQHQYITQTPHNEQMRKLPNNLHYNYILEEGNLTL